MTQFITEAAAALTNAGFTVGIFQTNRFTRIYFNSVPGAKLGKKNKTYINWSAADLECLPEQLANARHGVVTGGHLTADASKGGDVGGAFANKHNVMKALQAAGLSGDSVVPDLNKIIL
jgi:hypothetical protein